MATYRVAPLAAALLAAFLACAAFAADGRWPDPARLAGEVAAFAHADSVAPPPGGAIVFAGSSSIRMWHPRLAKDFAPLTVVGRGFGGSTARDLWVDLDPLVLSLHPRAVVLYEGDNDLLEGLPPQAIMASIDSSIGRIHAQLPEARIYVLPVKPSPSRWALWKSAVRLDQALQTRCKQGSWMEYVDVASPMIGRDGRPRPELFLPDSLHLNDRGYDVWVKALRPVLMRREAKHEPPQPRP